MNVDPSEQDSSVLQFTVLMSEKQLFLHVEIPSQDTVVILLKYDCKQLSLPLQIIQEMLVNDELEQEDVPLQVIKSILAKSAPLQSLFEQKSEDAKL